MGFSAESLRRLLLGREYFEELVLPLLREHFAKYEKEVIALDLGSASFGASDEDSDFDGMIVLTDALWREIGGSLNQTLANLPSWHYGSQKVRFFVGRYSNFGFGDFFADHSLDRWYELPLATHWHVQHYYRYYDPKEVFHRFQEDISNVPVEYLQHRVAGHFFQLFSHREMMEKALVEEDKVSFYINLGEVYFNSLCLPFFADRETTPLWRWLFWVLNRTESSVVSELIEQIDRLSNSRGSDRAVDLFREYYDEVVSVYLDLDLLPSSWLSTPVRIPSEHKYPGLSPRLRKLEESLEVQQRRELWASWYRLSSLVFWLLKVVKRKDSCAGHIATGRALANAVSIAKILPKPFDEEVTRNVAKSVSEIDKYWDWGKRGKELTDLQNNVAESLKKSDRIHIRYIENPTALMEEDLDLSD